MDAPNIVVPRPYAAAEPSDVLERSTSLDITPERPVKKSKLPLLKKSDLAVTQGAPVFRAARQPHELSHPQIHSTALLQDKIRQLKLDRDNEVKLPPNSLLSRERGVTGDVRFASANSGGLVGSAPPRGASAASGREELEEMANMKPVKQEVNFPLHASRYKDLIPVSVSDESFQKLTFKPRKVQREARSKGAKEVPLPEGRVVPREPLLMDLFVPSLEWEEAEWGCSGMEPEPPRPVSLERNDVFMFHELFKELDSI